MFGLKADGLMTPGGETAHTLQTTFGRGRTNKPVFSILPIKEKKPREGRFDGRIQLTEADGKDGEEDSAQESPLKTPPKPAEKPEPPERTPPKLTSPVPKPKMRNDLSGLGHFGADRWDKKAKKIRPHPGVDILADVDSPVTSTASGTVTKIGKIYNEDGKRHYRYVEVTDEKGNRVRHFYVSPGVKTGMKVEAGKTVLGRMQDIAKSDKKNKKMQNHLHLEIIRKGSEEAGEKIFIDPTALMPWLKR